MARSLQIRTEESLGEYTEQYAGRRRRYRYTPRRSNFAPSLQVADLDAGVALWEAYTTSAERAVAQLGDEAMKLRYEDLLADPDAVMGRLLEFCGLAAPRTRTWAGRVDAERAFAHRNEPELVAAAERHGDLLAAHGYS